MRGEPVAGLIRQNALMPSVVADAINEALVDEIGDSGLMCEGDEITLIEDYREDLELLLEGDHEWQRKRRKCRSGSRRQ